MARSTPHGNNVWWGWIGCRDVACFDTEPVGICVTFCRASGAYDRPRKKQATSQSFGAGVRRRRTAMKRVVSIVAALLVTALSISALAGAYDKPSDDRSSAFVEGEVDPTEAFGQVEGPVLLILGLLALAFTFALLIASKRIQTSNKASMSELEKQILPRGDSDGR